MCSCRVEDGPARPTLPRSAWHCAAIVDRLTFNGTIIETGTDSYRLAHSQSSAHE